VKKEVEIREVGKSDRDSRKMEREREKWRNELTFKKENWSGNSLATCSAG
jgi:hypothetical protein